MRRHRESCGDAAQSETPRTSGHSTRENRETSVVPTRDAPRGPVGEGRRRTADMYAAEESDEGIVPTNAPNKDGGLASAEEREGRPSAERNSEPSASLRTQRRRGAPSGSSGGSAYGQAHRTPPMPLPVRHSRWEPDAGNLPVRICAGGAP